MTTDMADRDNASAGHVSHDEAEAILRRFNASHWGNGEHARYSFPADPGRDDDIRLGAYIAAARKTESDRDAMAAEVERLREALAESEARAAKAAEACEALEDLVDYSSRTFHDSTLWESEEETTQLWQAWRSWAYDAIRAAKGAVRG